MFKASTQKIKIGILRESKIPVDWRVPLKPAHCKEVLEQFSNVDLFIQPSDNRCFSNKEYTAIGVKLKEDLSDCDLLMGIKEVAEHVLIPNKKYMFFSHTIKKQPQNKKLLQAIIEKNIEMIDYECIVDNEGKRLIAFGKFAGIVGAYNSLRLYGKKYSLFNLKPAYQCFNYEELKNELHKIILPPIKIVVTGSGRVGNGVKELLDFAKIKEVDKESFLTKNFDHPVYTRLGSADYHKSIKEGTFSLTDFHINPQNYKSTFLPYAKASEILIAGAFWHPKAPVLFSSTEMNKVDFKLKLIGDITCDFNGSIPSTIKPTTIYDPAYDFNPQTGEIEPPFSDEKNITVMAIENLPGELPRDASSYFGEMLIKNVLPSILLGTNTEKIERATIAKNGKLTPRYDYLKDYIAG